MVKSSGCSSFLLLILVLVVMLCQGCAKNQSDASGSLAASLEESASVETVTKQTEISTQETSEEESQSETETESGISFEKTDEAVWFSHSAGFYSESISVSLVSAGGSGVIHYTTDGTVPDETSPVYEKPIKITAGSSDFPKCVCVQAVLVDDDKTASEPVGHCYFVNTGISTRFTTLVFCVNGSADELVNEPDGIFADSNIYNRGREYEREVYLEAYTADGEKLLGQYCGVRIFGGVSRESSVKSMKLFARKSYDSEYGKFNLSVFESTNAAGQLIEKYDKLVLRNAGNDFQFAYIRDELCQTLAGVCGFSDYEAVVLAVGYLNGSYYGFYWLHESYCDDYFKEKYGDADGEFVIIEGTEQYKNDSDDEAESEAAVQYNEMYEEFSEADLTDESVYEELASFVDVENYLDYYAFNMYICNKDWPNNNYKCYRYQAADGEGAGDGVFDGRWRFLLHDTDYTFGLYEQRETKANYDTYADILNENSERYSPLFAALMERDDCRQYFTNKTLEYINGGLSAESVLSVLDEMKEQRDTEQEYYYEYLKSLRDAGDDSIWTWADHLDGYVKLIEDFAVSRPKYAVKYLEKNFDAVIGQSEDGSYVILSDDEQSDAKQSNAGGSEG